MQETAGVLHRSGSTIHYWVAGHHRAPLVAFTHGTSMDMRMFAPQLQAVWDAGYRTLRWDMRGHGRSRPIGTVPFTLANVGDDLLALLDSLLMGRQACLVGHSLGAHVSQHVVFARPERIAALVLVGSTCVTVPARPWRTVLSASSPMVQRLRTGMALRHRLARASAVDPAVQTYAFEATDQFSKSELISVWRASTTRIRAHPGYRIEQPLLLTHGEYDFRRRVSRFAPKWAARDPRCEYEVVRRAGHHANQDNPAAFNAILVEFLARHFPIPRGLGRTSG